MDWLISSCLNVHSPHYTSELYSFSKKTKKTCRITTLTRHYPIFHLAFAQNVHFPQANQLELEIIDDGENPVNSNSSKAKNPTKYSGKSRKGINDTILCKFCHIN